MFLGLGSVSGAHLFFSWLANLAFIYHEAEPSTRQSNKMPSTLPDSVDASNKFEDLSGVDIRLHANPYDALIEACQDDPVGSAFLFSPAPCDLRQSCIRNIPISQNDSNDEHRN